MWVHIQRSYGIRIFIAVEKDDIIDAIVAARVGNFIWIDWGIHFSTARGPMDYWMFTSANEVQFMLANSLSNLTIFFIQNFYRRHSVPRATSGRARKRSSGSVQSSSSDSPPPTKFNIRISSSRSRTGLTVSLASWYSPASSNATWHHLCHLNHLIRLLIPPNPTYTPPLILSIQWFC